VWKALEMRARRKFARMRYRKMMYPANIWIKSNRDPAEFARRSDIHATRSRDAANDAQEREVAGAGSVDFL
jgi:hypothetical protein